MLKSRGLLFTAALSADKNVIETAYDFEEMESYFDFFNVMTFNYQEGQRFNHESRLRNNDWKVSHLL